MITFDDFSLGALVAAFAVAGAVVLVCGVRLTRLADRFADVTGLGEAVTGAVFLGALTSMAGSVTSITGAAQGHADLAMSNAIGGIAAQTVFLVLADLAWRRANLEHAAVSVANMISGAMLIVLLGALLLAAMTPPVAVAGVHPVSPALFLLYLMGVRLAARATKTPMWAADRTDETRPDEPEEPPGDGASIARLSALLVALTALVGLAGWAIAETGLAIAAKTGLREGLVGALMTSVATSTPELVTTVAAARRGALTLAVGGVLGGNSFDVLFAAFSDVAHREGSIYHAASLDQRFLSILAIVMTGVLLLGLLSRERHGPANIGFESVALLVIYGGGLAVFVWAF